MRNTTWFVTSLVCVGFSMSAQAATLTMNFDKTTYSVSDTIVLTVTHLEVAEDNVPCTRDLPVVETAVSLGSNFQSGEEYTVVINGQVTETFKAQ